MKKKLLMGVGFCMLLMVSCAGPKPQAVEPPEIKHSFKIEFTPSRIELIKKYAELIRYLKQKYPGIEILIGHSEYRQLEGPSHPGLKFFHENDPDYRTVKSDPGPNFMNALREELKDILKPGAKGQVFK